MLRTPSASFRGPACFVNLYAKMHLWVGASKGMPKATSQCNTCRLLEAIDKLRGTPAYCHELVRHALECMSDVTASSVEVLLHPNNLRLTEAGSGLHKQLPA